MARCITRARVQLAALAVAGGLGVLTASGPALADIIQYNLPSPNFTPSPCPCGTVQVDLISSTEALITFTSNTANGIFFHSNGAVAVNSNGAATISNISGNGTGTFSDGGSGTEDGFGSFSNSVSINDGFNTRASIISFDLNLTSGTWADAAAVLTTTGNGKGFLAAAQIGLCNTGCTAFSTTGFAGNGPEVPVPEPASLALLGSGLIGLGWIRRRRRQRQQSA